PCCPLHVSDHWLAIPVVRVYEQSEHPCLRNQLGKQFQPLGYELNGKDTDAREVPARPSETRDESIRHRVGAGGKDNWDRRGSMFCRAGAGRPDRSDYVDVATDQVSSQCSQPIIATLCPGIRSLHFAPRHSRSPSAPGQKP